MMPCASCHACVPLPFPSVSSRVQSRIIERVSSGNLESSPSASTSGGSGVRNFLTRMASGGRQPAPSIPPSDPGLLAAHGARVGSKRLPRRSASEIMQSRIMSAAKGLLSLTREGDVDRTPVSPLPEDGSDIVIIPTKSMLLTDNEVLSSIMAARLSQQQCSSTGDTTEGTSVYFPSTGGPTGGRRSIVSARTAQDDPGGFEGSRRRISTGPLAGGPSTAIANPAAAAAAASISHGGHDSSRSDSKEMLLQLQQELTILKLQQVWESVCGIVRFVFARVCEGVLMCSDVHLRL